jgi:hypothetical protein
MYKNLKVNIIKNDKPLPKESESDSSDYEYLYDDELQILSESDEMLFNLKGYEFKSYVNYGKYLIIDIDEGHKFSEDYIILNLDTFKIYHQIFWHNNNCYRINYDKVNKKIVFYAAHPKDDLKFDIEYFFDNQDEIIKDYECNRHQFDSTKDTLLKGIFDLFGKSIDKSCQIKIDGFTYGMGCNDIDRFKNIMRDNTLTIEKQLAEIMWSHPIKYNQKIYDLELTIHYKDNGIDKQFKILLECKDKEPQEIYGGGIVYYGYYDENAKLKLVSA